MTFDPTLSVKPYYSDDFVVLYHGDCTTSNVDWMNCDVLITDPPYGRAWRQGTLRSHPSNNAAATGIAGDQDTAVRDTALQYWGPKKRAIVFGDLMLPPPQGTKLTCIYQKGPDGGLRGAIGGVRRDAEAIYLIGKDWKSGIGGRSSVFHTTQQISGGSGLVASTGGHPHTKPGDVMAQLIRLTDGWIADPFAGSGSTLVAAKLLGRRAVGVEIDERYCEIAAKRLAQDVLPL